jgi:hypothetical protein
MTTRNETQAQTEEAQMVISDATFKSVAAALCPWGAGYELTRAALGDRGIDHCWEMADGYGRLSLGTLRSRGLSRDWSHIRDSSDVALARVAGYLERHGILACATCAGSGSVRPHPTALVWVDCPDCGR